MSLLVVLNVNIFALRVIDQSYEIGLVFIVILDREGVKQKKDRWRGGGNYSRVVIISNILTKRGRLFEGGD